MIIAGDVALGTRGMKLVMPNDLRVKNWVVNLEGSLVKDGFKYIPINGVFNDYDSIVDLKSQLNIQAVSLANNHILDAAPISSTLSLTKSLGLQTVGAGENIREANKAIIIEDYIVVAFGWECIECPQSGSSRQGVNPYNKGYVINTVRSIVGNGKVVCIFHWNYEFELYPQPFDRELAHQLIDMGVYAIVGAHAHRVQHVEMYKGHPIVYGVGNFMFSRKLFFNYRLEFGERSRDEMAFELKADGTFALHHFEYDSERNQVSYTHTDELTPYSCGNAPYEGVSSKEYMSFFQQNRVQRKLLPVFYYNEPNAVRRAKSIFIAFRGNVLSMLVKIGAKSQKR